MVPSSHPNPNMPLSDILVADFSRVLAGPFCTQQLADMGAEVIKIERPDGGDDTRRFGPPFYQGTSTYFLAINRGKKSATLDLKDEGDLEIARRIVLEADVLVENFRPGTMERLGLGWEQLKKENPGLVYASIAGYGATHGLPEYTRRPGYDLVAQGVGGMQGITGFADGPPTKCGNSIADLTAGLYAFQGIVLALLARHRTGRGQRVDISMQDCQAALLTYHATAQILAGKPGRRMGNAHPSIAPYETFPTSDGFINIAAANQVMFERLAKALGQPELIQDPEFADNAQRVMHRDRLMAILSEHTQRYTQDELVTLLTLHGVVAGPILSVQQVLEHPQIQARGMVIEQEHPNLGLLKLLGCPISLDMTPARYGLPPPELGQHTQEIRARFAALHGDESEVR